jgi:hypothetical protein
MSGSMPNINRDLHESTLISIIELVLQNKQTAHWAVVLESRFSVSSPQVTENPVSRALQVDNDYFRIPDYPGMIGKGYAVGGT